LITGTKHGRVKVIPGPTWLAMPLPLRYRLILPSNPCRRAAMRTNHLLTTEASPRAKSRAVIPWRILDGKFYDDAKILPSVSQYHSLDMLDAGTSTSAYTYASIADSGLQEITCSSYRPASRHRLTLYLYLHEVN